VKEHAQFTIRPSRHGDGHSDSCESVHIPIIDATRGGNLEIPRRARGIVQFAHGSGSSRHRPRNQFVARVLRAAVNRRALAELRCEKKLAVVPRATHLFEESGALEEVAALAAQWFQGHWK
jgi:putative phosphoribosyl transferase